MQAQYRESVLLFHVAKNGSDIRFSLFMPYIIPHTPAAHLSMGCWARPYLKEKILCRDPLAAEGLCFFISQEIASCEIKMLRRDAQLAEMKSSLCEPLVRRDCATAQSLLFYRKLYPIKQNLRLHCHSCRKGEPYEKIH